MQVFQAGNTISIDQLRLRYWYQLAGFKHLLLTTCSFGGYLLLLLDQTSNVRLENAFLFLGISSLISFVVYLIISSDSYHTLFYQTNADSLNTFKLFEYSISGPITILSYTSIIPVSNGILELIIYFGLVLNILLAGVVDSIDRAKKFQVVVFAILGSLVSIATFGTLVFKLVQTPVSTNYMVYGIISLFVITRVRYFFFIITSNKQINPYIWLSKRFITMDFQDRVFLLISLIVLTVTMWG